MRGLIAHGWEPATLTRLVTGNGFGRANQTVKKWGFSPCRVGNHNPHPAHVILSERGPQRQVHVAGVKNGAPNAFQFGGGESKNLYLLFLCERGESKTQSHRCGFIALHAEWLCVIQSFLNLRVASASSSASVRSSRYLISSTPLPVSL